LKLKQKGMKYTEEYNLAYRILENLPRQVIKDFIWENENDWVTEKND